MNISKELMSLLEAFLHAEIAGLSLKGVTYSMTFKDKEGQKLYDRYSAIRDHANKDGFKEDELFRIREITNGYLFDLDFDIAKQIMISVAEEIAQLNKEDPKEKAEVFVNGAIQRRQDDMIRLAKLVEQEISAGKNAIEVALFSRHSVPRITITGLNSNREPVVMMINSYAVRNWDLGTVNKHLLIPKGLRIAKVSLREILPEKNGIRTILNIERI